MAAQLEGGPIAMSGSEDIEGHRTYKVSHRINVTAEGENFDGPQIAMDCEELPQEGDVWAFGNDLDQWAWCTTEKTCESVQPKQGYPIVQFIVTQTFTAKPPPPNKQRCNDFKIEDPLLEPPKIRVSTTLDKEEAVYDRFGRYITNSAWEQLRGPQVEFNKSALKVRIEMNVPVHNLPILAAARDTVNGTPMWGMPVRTVLLASVDLDRKYLGRCEEYWTLVLEFEVKAETWDRYLMDEGTKVLNGRWHETEDRWVLIDIDGEPPDPNNPAHFIQFPDRQGNSIRGMLNGRGQPATRVGLFPMEPQGFPVRAFEYNIGDYVEHGGENYVAIKRNTNVQPVDLGPLFSDTWAKTTHAPNIVIGEDDWSNLTDYVRGDLVIVVHINAGGVLLASQYVALKSSGPTLSNPKDPQDPANVLFWRYLPNGVTNLGEWVGIQGNNIYTPVDANDEPTGIGEVFVSKYGEYDFLLLGIPAIF